MARWIRSVFGRRVFMEQQGKMLDRTTHEDHPRLKKVAVLPPEAKAKLESLRALVAEARYVSQGVGHEKNDALALLRQADADVAAHRNNASGSEASGRPTICKTIGEAQAWFDREEAAYSKIADRGHRARSYWQELQGPVKAIEQWLELRAVAHAVITMHRGPEPKALKNETAEVAIERCRRRVRELKADLHRVQSAPYPSAHAKALAAQYVDQLREQGSPAVHFLLEAGVPRVDWPLYPPAHVPDHVAFAAWANPQALLTALCRDIDETADDDAALTAEQRSKQSATIAADKLATEREEEFWVDKAGVMRRADCDPRAILNLASDLPPPEGNF